MPRVIFIFRSALSNAFSIERVFKPIIARFKDVCPVDVKFLPFESSSVIKLIANSVWFAWISLFFDVIYLTGDAHYALLLSPRRNTILIIHDCIIMSRAIGIKRKILRFLWLKLPLLRARKVTAISNATVAELASYGIDVRHVQVIPNSVREMFLPNSKIFNAVEPRILHIGTNWNKNLARTIESLSGVSCKLIVIGHNTPELSILSERFNVRIEFKSNISDVEMLNEYNNCDIVSFPSLYEGFGMPIIEAQAVGRVVVTSDREPMRSVAGSAAILVDPESVESIHQGFLRCINDVQLRTNLILAGKVNIRHYSVEEISSKYMKLSAE